MSLNITDRHTPRYQADHQIVETRNAPLMLGHQRRFELAVAVTASLNEASAGSRRVGTNHHLTGHRFGIVAGPMSAGYLFGKLGDPSIKDTQPVRSVVGGGVRWPQRSSQRLAGGVGETEQRMKPEPVFEVCCGAL